jgi:hypothetical protein
VVHEQITRILIPPVAVFDWPPDPVDRAAAVGVKKATGEVTGILRHDPLLPRL